VGAFVGHVVAVAFGHETDCPAIGVRSVGSVGGRGRKRLDVPLLNHRSRVQAGLLADDGAELPMDFFSSRQ
jgi:hypothetical protein